MGFFVSYTQADRPWAEWVAWQLEEDGCRVLIQAWDMVPGSNWAHRMQEGVRRASRTVAVLSAAYADSVFATAEREAAWRGDPLGEQRKLVVFRVADCERPGLLSGVVSVDLFGVGKAAARRLSGPRSAARSLAGPSLRPSRVSRPRRRQRGRSRGFPVPCPRCGMCRRVTRTSPGGRPNLAVCGRGW
jgi:hypothetical protein